MRRPALRRSRGISLIEFLFSTAILAIVLVPLILLTVTGARVASDTTARGDAEARARRAVDRMSDLISAATWDSVDTFSAFPAWSSTLSYDAVTNVTMTSGVLTLRGMRLEWQRDPQRSGRKR